MLRERARIAAFGIVGTADERAELSKLQRQAPGVTRGATARIAAVRLGGENMRAEKLVEIVEHFGRTQVFGLRDGCGKVRPELPQHVFPIDLGVGDKIKFLLQRSGEIIFHIAREETFKEGDDEAALVFRIQALFVEPHIFAVAQHGER